MLRVDVVPADRCMTRVQQILADRASVQDRLLHEKKLELIKILGWARAVLYLRNKLP